VTNVAIPETLAELVVPIESLRSYGRNPRRGDLGAIRRSLEANGQYRPLVVNKRTGEVLAGNHTWQAALDLGWTEIAVTYVDVDDEQAARIVLVDNRTNDLAGYDDGELAALLESLDDLDGTGFAQDDLDTLLALLDEATPKTEPEMVEPPAEPITRPGDLWTLGDHRLLCGDCRDADAVARLLGDRQIQLAFTSPPYAQQRDYDKASGFEPVPPAEYVEWFRPAAENVAAHLAADGSWFVNIKPTAHELDMELYVFDLVLAHVREWGWHFATEFCWERSGVPKHATRRFKNQFEPIYQFARGEWKFRPQHVRHTSAGMIVPLGADDGNRDWKQLQGKRGGWFDGQVTDSGKRRRGRGYTGPVSKAQGIRNTNTLGSGPMEGWAYPGNRLPTFTHTHEIVGHPAAYPVGLPEFFVKAYTDPGDLVYDPFMGSGSTLLAGENQKRPVCGIEISPGYCDVTVTRWERHTGREAVRD
jgi:DNA modification methylase